MVENDAIMALAAANEGDLFGMVVVCGTGMIVIGVDRTGERGRAGGRGRSWMSGGSGFAIGSDALRAVASAEHGLGAPTLLTEAVLSHLRSQQSARVGALDVYRLQLGADRCPCPAGQPVRSAGPRG